MRKQRYLRMSIVVSAVTEDTEKTDDIIKGLVEDMQYRAEGNEVYLRLEQAYEIPPEMGQQYFSIWRN